MKRLSMREVYLNDLAIRLIKQAKIRSENSSVIQMSLERSRSGLEQALHNNSDSLSGTTRGSS